MHTLTRLGALTASCSLVAATFISVGSPAQAVDHDPIGVDAGAAWLSDQLTRGLMHNPTYGGFDDYGLSIDTGLALAAVGGHQVTVGTISDAVAARVASYTTGADYGAPGDVFSGALAKSAVLAQVAGDDPRAFGGTDLITRLESTVATAAPITGRIQDQGSADYANTIGQAYAARALFAASSGRASSVTGFLLQQQCASGYFRVGFTQDKSASDQSCADGTDAPDTDATALAVLQLEPQLGNGAVAAALAKARTWLLARQHTDGSFGGGAATEGSNTNSTGLAAAALGAGPASEKAAQWVRARQATAYDLCDRLAGQQGAIAYDDAGLQAGRKDGITDASSDQFRRASAQALLALEQLPVDTTPARPVLTAATGYLKAGTRLAVRTSGVHAGDRLCLSGVGASVQGTATTTSWSATVTLPSGTAVRRYVVRDADGHTASRSVSVLGAKRLSVTRTPGRVKRSRTVTVAARGLAPHEPARIYYGRSLVRSGLASASGNLVARFGSGRSLGKKSIRAYGRFADIRSGATTVRVVR